MRLKDLSNKSKSKLLSGIQDLLFWQDGTPVHCAGDSAEGTVLAIQDAIEAAIRKGTK